ncbi:hypothetical protein XELAEV_18031453mg [Xenopus laevis]|uniref:Uncharacterized protein n=1 Tax=Xenopus laevis TaxID=8355 RepID=A0A974CNU1_XENLA|nr:hypothetical protein XELAEV_18031453mg [Xenopus laevis]
MWWTCKIVREFWKMVAHTLSTIFRLSIEPDPLSFLLGLPLTTLKTSDANKLATHILMAAKTLRAAKWKSTYLPNQQALIIKVKWIRNMETIRAYLHGTGYKMHCCGFPGQNLRQLKQTRIDSASTL